MLNPWPMHLTDFCLLRIVGSAPNLEAEPTNKITSGEDLCCLV